MENRDQIEMGNLQNNSDQQQRFTGYKNSSADLFIKILLLGDTGVGKSSLMAAYAEGEFPTNMVGTAGIDHKIKTIKHQGKTIKVEIWDTAG